VLQKQAQKLLESWHDMCILSASKFSSTSGTIAPVETQKEPYLDKQEYHAQVHDGLAECR
jgi:hypothetical protein